MPPTKTKVRTAVFMSTSKEPWVFVTRGWTEQLAYGEIRKHQPKVAEFENHRFVADEAAARKLGITLEELVTRLREHAQNRDSDGCTDAVFWELTAEQAAPPADEALQEIGLLAAARDLDGLVALLEEEREGFGRPKVIGACETILERLTAA